MAKMIKLLLLSFIFQSFFSSTPAHEITSVTIYPHNASVTKVINASVNKGENLIKLSGLPSSIANQSVQVEVVKGKGVKITDVKVEETYLEKPEVEKVSKLKAKIDSLNDLISLKVVEIEVVSGKIEFLKKLSPSLQVQRFTVTEIENYFKFYGKTLNENFKEKIKLEKELEKLKQEKKTLEDELGKITFVKEKGKNIEIYLLSDFKGEIALRISYLVFSAGWLSGYEVRVNSLEGKVEFNFFAFVRQSTGEDWVNVPVEISTAQVTIWGMPPEIMPWNVDVYQPTPIKPFLGKVQGVEREELKAEMPEPSSGFVVPEVESAITSVNFKLQKLSIPSDNQLHKVFLSSFSSEVPLVYYAVPKLSRYAYLRASLKNEFSFTILPGEARIFIDGRYVSTSSLKKILPGEIFNLSFGVDGGIKVDRRLKKKFTEYTGAFGRNKKISYEYEIEVENGKMRDVLIEVKDNFPVSRNEKIKVVLESPSEKEAEIGSDGIVTWRINLKSGEKKVLILKFYIEHPKDIEVVGLE